MVGWSYGSFYSWFHICLASNKSSFIFLLCRLLIVVWQHLDCALVYILHFRVSTLSLNLFAYSLFLKKKARQATDRGSSYSNVRHLIEYAMTREIKPEVQWYMPLFLYHLFIQFLLCIKKRTRVFIHIPCIVLHSMLRILHAILTVWEDH